MRIRTISSHKCSSSKIALNKSDTKMRRSLGYTTRQPPEPESVSLPVLNPDCLWQIFQSLSLSDVLSCCLAAPNYFNDAAQIFFARNVKQLKIHQKQPTLRAVRRKLTSYQTAMFLLRLIGAHVTNLTVLYEGFNAAETKSIAVAVQRYCTKLLTYETDAKSKPILPDLQALQSIIIRNSLYWNENGKVCDLLTEYLSKCNSHNLNAITWFDSTKYQKLPGYFETIEIQYQTRPHNCKRLAQFLRLHNLTTFSYYGCAVLPDTVALIASVDCLRYLLIDVHINYYSKKSILQINELLEELSKRNTVERLELSIDIKGTEVIRLTEKVSKALENFTSLLDLKLSAAFYLSDFEKLPRLKILTCSNEKTSQLGAFTDDLIFFANNVSSLESLFFTSPKGHEIKTNFHIRTMFRFLPVLQIEYTK